MTGAKKLLAVCAVTVSAWASTTSVWAADPLALPGGSRVGIIDMMRDDLTHFHVGKSRVTSFMRTYPIGWPVAEVVDDPIPVMLTGLGLQPVFLDPPKLLWRQRQSWIVSDPRADELPRDAEEEIGRLLEAENLQALVIVAPAGRTVTSMSPLDSVKAGLSFQVVLVCAAAQQTVARIRRMSRIAQHFNR